MDNRESWIEQAKNYRVPPAVGKISVAAPVRYEAENARYELAVPDYGFRRSLLEFLLQRGCSCTVYPAYTPAQELLATHPDGILLSLSLIHICSGREQITPGPGTLTWFV